MLDRTLTSRRLWHEIWIVLGLSLGASGVYALVSLVRKATLPGGIKAQTATLNSSQDTRQVFDFIYQILGIGFALVPVALVIYLLSLDRDQPSPMRRLGVDRSQPGRDIRRGLALAAMIGLPGLGLYFAGRELGITATVIPAPDVAYWWTVPVLILAAMQNALLEQFVVVGFLMTRLQQLGWSTWSTIVASAALRSSYHLYQGFGAGVGNFVMGLVFGYWFTRTKRLLPLIIAHTLLDTVAFVGYLTLADRLSIS